MKKEDIGSLYDASVDAYDSLYMEEQLSKYKVIFDLIGKNGYNLVDIGVGTGIYFSKYLGEYQYLIGVDISYRSLLRAYRRGEKLNIDLIYGDGEDPPLRLESVDFLFSITVLHHFKDPMNYINKTYNRVRRGVLLSFLNKVFSEDDVREVSSKFGCTLDNLQNDYLIFCKKI